MRRRGERERKKWSGEMMNGGDDRDADKGLIWKLPVLKTKELGKIGPAFAFGAGCGFGFGVGLIGGTHYTIPTTSILSLLA